MNILIIYPHGLGDCLMLTPSLRTYYKKYGVKLSVAILQRFESSKIFANNPYVDKVFPVLKDAWNDFSSVEREGNKVFKIVEAASLMQEAVSYTVTFSDDFKTYRPVKE